MPGRPGQPPIVSALGRQRHADSWGKLDGQARHNWWALGSKRGPASVTRKWWKIPPYEHTCVLTYKHTHPPHTQQFKQTSSRSRLKWNGWHLPETLSNFSLFCHRYILICPSPFPRSDTLSPLGTSGPQRWWGNAAKPGMLNAEQP